MKESDHSAYNEIYHRYFFLIFTHAYKKLQDEEQAKDIVQDVFATLWFKRDINLPVTNLAGYLFVAVRNKIFDHFAHEKVRTKYVDSLHDYWKTNPGPPTDHRIRENELKGYIEKAVNELPPKMRQVFEMSRIEELSYKEIAAQLHTTENNVSKQVNNALRLIKTKLGSLALITFLINL
ncbi:RNA polymerase sigma-70 factor [Mucilaginibacter hurinus]|uniref:RNA polymerase sigma-70 factor n=1 Tax=Mucilaginibacter hurinus TaxID=2201324 RepID=UPI001F46FC3F|nr:RNA polymerase sigma-70 factor [Mucilaginibacter hurinus]